MYSTFMEECVSTHVAADRLGRQEKSGEIDARPIRLTTINAKAEGEASRKDGSLLDHLLSVTRGALMFWLSNAPRTWSSISDLAEIERLSYALVGIAFLHDIDKDLGLRRSREIRIEALAERMERYNIDAFLQRRGLRISPAAMLNYIDEQYPERACSRPTAPDYDGRISKTASYVELADHLEQKLHDASPKGGVDRMLAVVGKWPLLQNQAPKHWEKVEIQDQLHAFLLKRLQQALSSACKDVAGHLPLIEIVEDGQLLCVIPKAEARNIKTEALARFLEKLQGLASQADDTAGSIEAALRRRFSGHLTGSRQKRFKDGDGTRHCSRCKEPMKASPRAATPSKAHGIKRAALPSRERQKGPLAAPPSDSQICWVCVAEKELRETSRKELEERRDLPPVISSPATAGLFGGLALWYEGADVSRGLTEPNRPDAS